MNGPFRFLDPETPISITRKHLPHWDQGGSTYFITWRLGDSIPKHLWEQWQSARAAWLRDHDIDPDEEHWRRGLELLPASSRREFFRFFTEKFNAELDSCHGECLLRNAGLARIVSNCLHHFDGQRYTMGDFVVMPNHVHLLVGGLAHGAMLKQVESWKKWSALQINRSLGRHGKLWQGESFDHLVRNQTAFEKYRNYIAENPLKAGLRAGEFHYWRRPE